MVPPNGRYGWIIVISYAIANVIKQRDVQEAFRLLNFSHK